MTSHKSYNAIENNKKQLEIPVFMHIRITLIIHDHGHEECEHYHHSKYNLKVELHASGYD